MKFLLLIKFLILALGSVVGIYAHAISLIIEVENQATQFANVKDYKSAFQLMRETIEKAEEAGNSLVANDGYLFLRANRLIANEAVAGISLQFVARIVCESGFDQGMAQMDRVLNSKLATTANLTIIWQKAKLLHDLKEKYGSQTGDVCSSLSDDAVAEANAEANAIAAANAEAARLKAEEVRLLGLKEVEEAAEKKRIIAERVKAAPGVLRNDWGKELFCVNYGNFLRGSTPLELEDVNNVGALFQNEVARRGISVERKLVTERKVRIGMSECGVHASWGSPTATNRTVGAWGEHKQLVYGSRFGSSYIYIQNGRVSSFQD